MHKNLEKMKYRIKKETKPKLPTYGKYKAVAVHNQICGTNKMLKTDDIHPPKSVISVHFFCLTCLMALQI